MPWIISQLVGALLVAATSFVGRVLIALGFGFIEYQGISLLVTTVTDQAKSFAGSAGQFADWLGFMRFDQHISIIISAIGVKLLLKGLSGGSIKKLASR
jgi:hypothetical protein